MVEVVIGGAILYLQSLLLLRICIVAAVVIITLFLPL